MKTEEEEKKVELCTQPLPNTRNCVIPGCKAIAGFDQEFNCWSWPRSVRWIIVPYQHPACSLEPDCKSIKEYPTECPYLMF